MKKGEKEKKPRKSQEEPLTGRARSLANLKPQKAGEPSKNPKGKPKGLLNFKTRVQIAIDALAEDFANQHNKKKENKNNQIKAEDVDIMGDIFKQYLNKSRNGNDRVLLHFIEMGYGKPTQKLEHSGSIDSSIEMNVKVEDAKKRARAMLDRWTKNRKQNGNSRSNK